MWLPVLSVIPVSVFHCPCSATSSCHDSDSTRQFPQPNKTRRWRRQWNLWLQCALAQATCRAGAARPLRPSPHTSLRTLLWKWQPWTPVWKVWRRSTAMHRSVATNTSKVMENMAAMVNTYKIYVRSICPKKCYPQCSYSAKTTRVCINHGQPEHVHPRRRG